MKPLHPSQAVGLRGRRSDRNEASS